VLDQGRASPGQWVAVHGCGGVGLSAVQVAVAAGARVVAVDVSKAALDLAEQVGAEVLIDAGDASDLGGVPAAVRRATGGGGAHVSLDALGSATTMGASVRSLRKRGRHVQVGLLPPSLGEPSVPMSRVIFHELEILGSHGMAAHRYPEMLALVESGRLRPDLLVTRHVGLDEAGPALMAMDSVSRGPGVTVVLPQRSV